MDEKSTLYLDGGQFVGPENIIEAGTEPPEVKGLIAKSIEGEMYREYLFNGTTYRICSPMWLYYRSGGTTHRVVTRDGIVHCVPAPGVYGCVLRWKNKPNIPFIRF